MTERREYLETHSWLSFKLDLSFADPSFWMLLGEAHSKCDHIAGVPLPYEVGAKLHQLYLAKGVLATTAIEGNTLTEDQVIDQMQGTLKLPPSKEYLRQEIQNILDACKKIGTQLRTAESSPLTVDLICEFNKQVLKDLHLEENVQPGKIRNYGVSVGKYKGAPHQDCAWLLHELCRWLNEIKLDFPPIVTALLKAILAHLYIAWIHPFGDGNGRTARLIEFYILSGAGVPSPVAHLLSNHYNETRNSYYHKLNEARQNPKNPLPFVSYALTGFVEGLKQQLHIIRDFQWDLAWKDHVIELFRNKDRPSDRRRLHILLALGELKHSIEISNIPLLNREVAADCAGISSKTLSRDLHYLEEQGLIQHQKDRVRARREIVMLFLPLMSRADFLTDSIMPLVAARLLPEELYKEFLEDQKKER